MSEIIIVDNNDKIIWYKSINSLKKDDIYRVSALWITNSKNEILLAKRHHTKSHHPNKWWPAVSWTIEKWENYINNIIKETEEEIWLKNIKPIIWPKTNTNNEYNHFTQWFLLRIDKNIDEFILEKNEVEKVKRISVKELEKQFKKQQENFVPGMGKYFELFRNV